MYLLIGKVSSKLTIIWEWIETQTYSFFLRYSVNRGLIIGYKSGIKKP